MAGNGPDQPVRNNEENNIRQVYSIDKEYNGKMYSFKYFMEQGRPVFLNFNPADPFGKHTAAHQQGPRRRRWFGLF